ncbi:MAG: transketolase [Clostridia bacterium]|jgi:transketolase|nr:transketolase [Clostridia bacterium]MBR4292204.1 transketolase [Clostridia bacterium]
MEQAKIKELKQIAAEIRLGALKAVYSASSGHPGGSLSIADVLAYLYFVEMNVDPKNPKWEDRDRFVLSKGHCAPSYYAALAERGYFPKEDLETFRQATSYLQGHPDMKGVPGCDMTTGSLGLGISAACGMALSGKISNKDYRVYCVLGDGESEEGQVWEAAMFAAHKKLDNLCLFVDSNGLQIDGPVAEVVGPAPFESKFEAFGWNVVSIDGHDFEQIEKAAKAARECSGKPTAIIMTTHKGRGVSFMEDQVKWHGSAPNKEQYEQAVEEIKAAVAAL